MTTFHLVCPVWGQRAVDVFLNLGLPSQLAALEGYTFFRSSSYFIYTTQADAERIGQHPAFKLLADLMPVTFIIDDQTTNRGTWWDTFTACHRWQTMLADSQDAATFFLCADQIWSRGSFAMAALKIEDGFSAVVCAGPRVATELCTDPLTAQVRKNVLNVDGRYLMKHAFTAWSHYECRDSFFDAANYIQYVSYLLFHVENEGVLGRCYVLHPVVVKAQVKYARPNFEIFDQDYLNSACPNPDRIYVVQDSDEICHVSLAVLDMAYAQPTNDHYRDPIQAQAWFAEGWGWGYIHQEFAKRPIYLHSGDRTAAKWEEAVRRSGLIVDSIQQVLDRSDEELVYEYPENLLRRFENRVKHDQTLSPLQLRLQTMAQELVQLRQHRVWKHPITGQ